MSNVTLTDVGTYSVVVSNNLDSVTSSDATLMIVQPSLAEALDAPNLTWSTGGDGNWSPEIDTTHNGGDAVQSGVITNGQASWVQATVIGPGTLTFWWKVSSEENYDLLDFSTNGVSAAAISGEVDWQQETFILGSGIQTLRWTYSKDAVCCTGGSDAGWLDQVVFTSSASLPQLTILRSATNVIVTWPTNAAGFTLQSTTNLASPSVWITNAPTPVVVNGQNTVTNPVTGAQKFYRLSH